MCPGAAVSSRPTCARHLAAAGVLKLKGLPYTTTEAEVRAFFDGFNVSNVQFVYEPDGRPSGLAFAEFPTREEALQVRRPAAAPPRPPIWPTWR